MKGFLKGMVAAVLLSLFVIAGSGVSAWAKCSLHEAMSGDDVVKVAACLEQGGDFGEQAGYDGNTPLIQAIYDDDVKVAKLLIEKGAPIEAENRFGRRALYAAASQNNAELVELLIAHHADVEAAEEDKVTPLMSAADKGGETVTLRLLAAGASLKSKDYAGSTALHTAADNDAAGVVKVLLDHGAEINALDNNQRTATDIAAEGGLIEAFNVLIQSKGVQMAQGGKYGNSYMCLAASMGHIEMARQLKEGGKSVNERSSVDGATPLHFAVLKDRLEMINWLLQNGAEINAVDTKGNTPAHVAAVLDKKEALKLLIDKGANLKLYNTEQRTVEAIIRENEQMRLARERQRRSMDDEDFSALLKTLDACRFDCEPVDFPDMLYTEADLNRLNNRIMALRACHDRFDECVDSAKAGDDKVDQLSQAQRNEYAEHVKALDEQVDKESAATERHEEGIRALRARIDRANAEQESQRASRRSVYRNSEDYGNNSGEGSGRFVPTPIPQRPAFILPGSQ